VQKDFLIEDKRFYLKIPNRHRKIKFKIFTEFNDIIDRIWLIASICEFVLYCILLLLLTPDFIFVEVT